MITKLCKTVQEVIDSAYEPVTSAGELSVLGSGIALKNPVKRVLSKTLDPYVTRTLDEPNLRTNEEWIKKKLMPAMRLTPDDVYVKPGEVVGNTTYKGNPSDSFFTPRHEIDRQIAELGADAQKDVSKDVLRAKRGGVTYVGAPDAAVIAHELGHSKNTIFNKSRLVSQVLNTAHTHGALQSGIGALATYKRVRDGAKDPSKNQALTYAVNAAAIAPSVGVLADEGLASIHALRGLKNTGVSDAVLKAAKKKYGAAYLSYLLPALAYHGISNAAAYGLGKYHNYRDVKKKNI